MKHSNLRKILSGGVILAFIFILLSQPLYAFAGKTTGGSANAQIAQANKNTTIGLNAALQVAGDIAGTFFNFIAGVFLKVANFAGYVIGLMGTGIVYFGVQDDFTTNTLVVLGWAVVRDIANMFFIVVLIIIAFETILGMEEGGWKHGLPKFFGAVVLVNFSKVILGLLIDVVQIFTLTFFNTFASDGAGAFTQLFALEKLSSVVKNTAANPNPTSIGEGGTEIAVSLLITFLAVGIAIIMGKAVIKMLERYLVILFLVVLSPLAFLSQAVPHGEKLFHKWWEELIKQLLFGPFIGFFFWLIIATFAQDNTDIGDKLQSILQVGYSSGFIDIVHAAVPIGNQLQSTLGVEGVTVENVLGIAQYGGFVIVALFAADAATGGMVGGAMGAGKKMLGMAQRGAARLYRSQAVRSGLKTAAVGGAGFAGGAAGGLVGAAEGFADGTGIVRGFSAGAAKGGIATSAKASKFGKWATKERSASVATEGVVASTAGVLNTNVSDLFNKEKRAANIQGVKTNLAQMRQASGVVGGADLARGAEQRKSFKEMEEGPELASMANLDIDALRSVMQNESSGDKQKQAAAYELSSRRGTTVEERDTARATLSGLGEHVTLREANNVMAKTNEKNPGSDWTPQEERNWQSRIPRVPNASAQGGVGATVPASGVPGPTPAVGGGAVAPGLDPNDSYTTDFVNDSEPAAAKSDRPTNRADGGNSSGTPIPVTIVSDQTTGGTSPAIDINVAPEPAVPPTPPAPEAPAPTAEPVAGPSPSQQEPERTPTSEQEARGVKEAADKDKDDKDKEDKGNQPPRDTSPQKINIQGDLDQIVDAVRTKLSSFKIDLDKLPDDIRNQITRALAKIKDNKAVTGSLDKRLPSSVTNILKRGGIRVPREEKK